VETKDFDNTELMEPPAQPGERSPTYVFLATNESSYVMGGIFGVVPGKMLP
jgi:hypothetical protein